MVALIPAVSLLCALGLVAWSFTPSGRAWIGWALGWLSRVAAFPFVTAWGYLRDGVKPGGGGTPGGGKPKPSGKPSTSGGTPSRGRGGSGWWSRVKGWGRRLLAGLREGVSLFRGVPSRPRVVTTTTTTTTRKPGTPQGTPPKTTTPSPPKPQKGGFQNWAPQKENLRKARPAETSVRGHTWFGNHIPWILANTSPLGGGYLVSRHKREGEDHGLHGATIDSWETAARAAQESERLYEEAQRAAAEARRAKDEDKAQAQAAAAAAKAIADAAKNRAVEAAEEAAALQNGVLAPLFDAADSTTRDLKATPNVAHLRAAA